MKKKILFLIILMLICKMNVYAAAGEIQKKSNTNWEDIINEFKDASDLGDITSNETNINIKKNYEDIKYERNIKYENDEIFIIPIIPADKTNMSEKEIAYNAVIDNNLVKFLIYTISKLNDIDYKKIEEDKYSDYGITLEGEDVNYSNETEISSEQIESLFITKFIINLNQFEESTKSYKGTFEEESNPPTFNIQDDTSVELLLVKANPNSLDLNIVLDNIDDDVVGKCEIILIPGENSALETGESKTIATIDNCKKGSNNYTLDNLQPNTNYILQVMFNKETDDDTVNLQTIGKEYKTFKTTSKTEKDEITNPKTGSATIYIILFCFITSLIVILKKNGILTKKVDNN